MCLRFKYDRHLDEISSTNLRINMFEIPGLGYTVRGFKSFLNDHTLSDTLSNPNWVNSPANMGTNTRKLPFEAI